ncbi:MAG: hypothetical protein DRJ41_00735, partial [Thermoprotei archaeon]
MRHIEVPVLLLVIITLAISHTSYSQTIVTIDEKVDLSHNINYAEATLDINSSTPLNRIKFNVSNFDDLVSLVYAEVNGKLVGLGKVVNNSIVVPLNVSTNIATVKIFYDNVVSPNETDILVKTPVLLSPFDFRSNITLEVVYPSPQVNMINVNVTPEGGIIKLNYTNVPPGTSKIFLAKFDSTAASLISLNLTREIILKQSSEALVLDRYEVKGLSNRKLEELAFLYPKYVKIEGVEGPLGPYPLWKTGMPFYSPTYRVYDFGNSWRVRIKLRSPPLNIGEKTSLTVKLSLPIKLSEDFLELNPFFDVGYLITNYRVLLKVRGNVSLILPTEYELFSVGSDNNYKVYLLKTAQNIPLYSLNLLPPIRLKAKLVGEPGLNYLLLSILIAILGAIGGAIYYLNREEIAKAKKEILESERQPEIYTISRDRVELMESILDSWNRIEDGKITYTTYRQTVSLAMRRDESLSRRLSALVSELGKKEATSLIERLEYCIDEFKKGIKDLENLSKELRRGDISKHKYKSLKGRVIRKLEEK